MSMVVTLQNVIILSGLLMLVVATIYRYAIKKFKFDARIFPTIILFCFGSSTALAFSINLIGYIFFKAEILGTVKPEDLIVPAFIGSLGAAYLTVYLLVKFINTE